MEPIVSSLFREALATALALALPVVVSVAVVGVVIGVLQTIVQVQDQNVSFAPKLAVVALLTMVAGPAALASLDSLLTDIIAALPRLAHA